jgi:hypothetical protein
MAVGVKGLKACYQVSIQSNGLKLGKVTNSNMIFLAMGFVS